MIKLSKKTVIVTLALIAVIATAGTAFAYWASGFNNTSGTQTATIQIGSGGTVDTELTLEAMSGGKELVPSGRVGSDGATKTDSAEYTCNVLWESTDDDSTLDAAGVTGTLSVELTKITIGTTDYIAGDLPFVVSITDGDVTDDDFTITGDTALPLTFTFTMSEPSSQEQYLLVAGKSVVFTFTFTVEI